MRTEHVRSILSALSSSRGRWSPRLRALAPSVLILGLTGAGFLAAGGVRDADVRRDSKYRADVAAEQVRGRLEHGADVLQSLRRFLVGHATADLMTRGLAGTQDRWMSPVGLHAAAWGERVRGPDRAAYEQAVDHAIGAITRSGSLRPAAPRSSYLPATLVTGAHPLDVPGIDLDGQPGVAAAVARPRTASRATATPLVRLRDGTTGLFLVEQAELLSHAAAKPGFAVLFVPGSWLRAVPPDTERPQRRLQLASGGIATGDLGGATAARSTFTQAGQRFGVLVPRASDAGASGLLPWVIVAAGLALAALAARVGINAARRARSQREVDRIFALSPDLIAVAGFDGRFRRVNPAFESTLGYTQEALLGSPMLDVVDPGELEDAQGALDSLVRGDEVVEYENRAIGRDGSTRWLEWNARSVRDEGVIYAVGRDVTDRRRADEELRRAQRKVEASRDELRLLADEQAALRRVATLVAQDVSPAEVFEAVSAEVGRLLGAESTALLRYEPDGAAVLAHDLPGLSLRAGTRFTLEGEHVSGQVIRTGRSARVDVSDSACSPIAHAARARGVRALVGAPIVVEGRLWGAIASSWTAKEAPSLDVEARMAQFTELIASAIANADRRTELAASRARIVAAADETRRRIERDLHDGAQQRLVALALQLRAAQAAVPPALGELRAELSRLVEGQASVLDELREMALGIHPGILSEGGLGPALKTLARRSPIPVQLAVRAEGRLPERVEVAGYYVVSEALTNAAKYAHASVVHVDVEATDGVLRVAVGDDGIGGADPALGSGLLGLKDRAEAIGGTMALQSARGAGTSLHVELPLDDHDPQTSHERAAAHGARAGRWTGG